MMEINSDVYFSELPRVDIKRSIFNIPFNHKTSFNVGDLIPFYIMEVVPGDTHQITTSIVARLQTLLTPIMDSMNLETFYFFVPNRIVDDHWKNIMGENEDGPWIQDQVPHYVPNLAEPVEDGVTVGWKSGTIADYFGVPLKYKIIPEVGMPSVYPMAYPFRGYAMIVNEFFRDQNLQQPVVIHKDGTLRNGSNGSNYVTDLELGGMPFKVNRYHDYFSSCLPSPQKSESISIFGNFINSETFAPVYTREELAYSPTKMRYPALFANRGTAPGNSIRDLKAESDSSVTMPAIGSNMNTYVAGTSDMGTGMTPVNLWANLNVPQATITQLRLAFQLQKYYEKSARGGTRYREFLREFFGVSNGDSRMQIPEYLGGHRVPLSIHQIANTSQTATADLGDLGAMSNTSDVHEDFRMSFTEHGFIIGLMCVRFKNTYGQGLERFWTRRKALDFYNPVFAHISEQPVYLSEIYCGTTEETLFHNRVWGYNEAWADYRYKPDRVSGEMRTDVMNSLASWHLADDYGEAPYLSSDWLHTDANTVDRVLAVGSSVANQVFADIFVQDKAVRPMPVHSIPGLADHF